MIGDNGNGKLAAIYARVSSEEQAKGYSLPTQVEGCLELAKKEGCMVPEGYIFQEEISGTILDRPELRKVRELVNTKAIAAVIVHDPDRLARKLALQLLLDEEAERAGVKLLFVLHQREGNPEGTLFFHMRGALAEYERAKIMERTQRGRLGRVKAGYPGGGGAAYGYRYICEPHKGRFEIDEEEAGIVRRIFDLCLEGKTTRAITLILSREGVPTKKDRGAKGGRKLAGEGQWARSTIRGIVSNEAYTGRAFWGKKNSSRQKSRKRREREGWIEFSAPAIISEETFQAAQVQLTKNKANASRNRKYEYLFSGGRLRCGQCGHAMTGENPHNKGCRYTCCSRSVNLNGPFCKGSVKAAEVEARVWQAVEQVLMNPELIAQEVTRQQENSGVIHAEVAHEMELIELTLAKCDKEEKRWASAYAAEVISLAELKGYKVEIAARRGGLQGHKVELQARLEAVAQATAEIENLVLYCKRVRESLKNFDFAQKRLALEALDIRATWTPGEPLAIEGHIPMGELCLSPPGGTPRWPGSKSSTSTRSSPGTGPWSRARRPKSC